MCFSDTAPRTLIPSAEDCADRQFRNPYGHQRRSQQDMQTYYFLVPEGTITTGTGSASWPTTLAPNTVSPNAAQWDSQ